MANQRPEGIGLQEAQAEEMKAIEIFQQRYGRQPSSPQEWDEIQEIAWGKLPIYQDIVDGFIDAMPDKISEEELLKEAKKFYDPWFEYLLGDVVKEAETTKGYYDQDLKTALKRSNEQLKSFRQDIQTNKGYSAEDLNKSLKRIGTQRGWETEEYDAWKETEGRRAGEAQRLRDEDASARGLYRSGIREQNENFLGDERQANLDVNQRQFDRTQTGLDYAEQDAQTQNTRNLDAWNKNLQDYERQAGYQTQDIKRTDNRNRYSLKDWTDKQKRKIRQDKQLAYGTYVTDPEKKYEGYGFNNVY